MHTSSKTEAPQLPAPKTDEQSTAGMRRPEQFMLMLIDPTLPPVLVLTRRR